MSVNEEDEKFLQCFDCGAELIVDEHSGMCSTPQISNCAVLDQQNKRKCSECNPFFSLNPSRTACVSCVNDDLPDGCSACAVDKYNQTTHCTACIDNMWL